MTHRPRQTTASSAAGPGPAGPRRWCDVAAGVLACFSVLAAGANRAHAQASREYDLKAVFLYNLASFVDWPASAFERPDAPFVIGVVGDDPFGPVLDDVVAHEYVGAHPFVVRRFRRPEEATPCHLVFVSNSEFRRYRDVLRHFRGRPVLTVGDLPGFAEAGGMVGFGTQNARLELYVNPRAMREGSLDVSSKLLELAHIIEPVAAAP